MKTTILYLLILILVGVIIFQKCGNKPEVIYIKPKIDTKPIWKVINSKVAEITSLKKLGKAQDSIRVVYRDRWYKTKADTVHLTKTQIVNSCDSTRAKDSVAIVTKDKTILSQDSLNKSIWSLRSADSTNYTQTIDSLRKDNKAIAPRQIFYIGADVNTSKQVFISAGFDTKKGAFFGGYDPFNKQVRVGAYVKIKAWKRH
jgi:hypothetical protein